MSSVGEQENKAIQGKGHGMGMCLEVQRLKEMEKVRHNKQEIQNVEVHHMFNRNSKIENSKKKNI